MAPIDFNELRDGSPETINRVEEIHNHHAGAATDPPSTSAAPGPHASEAGASPVGASLHVSAELVTGTTPAASPTSLPRRSLTTSEMAVCATAIVLWVVFVAAGVTVGTAPYIDLINGTSTAAASGALAAAPAGAGAKPPVPPPDFFKLAQSWFYVITCYTFTNVAIISCLAAVIGAIGRSAGIDDVDRKDPTTDSRTLCVSGVIRGFFMYLVILSGILVLSDQKYKDIGIEQYLKLVGLCSVLSFAVGYDPHVFVTFFQRVGQWTSSPAPAKPS